MMQVVSNTTVQQLLKDFMLQETSHVCMEVKWFKTALNLTSLENFTNQWVTSPNRTEVEAHLVQNSGRVKFKVYLFTETINFKFRDMVGSFDRSEDTLLKLVTNFTDFKTLVLLIQLLLHPMGDLYTVRWWRIAICSKRLIENLPSISDICLATPTESYTYKVPSWELTFHALSIYAKPC